MYCRQCSYPLLGTPPGPCPECGRLFDPGNPDSYLALEPGPIARRRLRLMVAVAVGSTLFLLYWTLPALYATAEQFDLNSGQERTVHKIFGIQATATGHESDFGTFAKAHLQSLGPPVWAPLHNTCPADSFRNQHLLLYRRPHDPLRQLVRMFDAMEESGAAPPLPERIRLAEAALGLVAAQQCPIIDFVAAPGGSDLLGVQVRDENGIRVAHWIPANPERTREPSGP